MLNKVGSEKITLPQMHLLLRFAVYKDSYLDTNPKVAIYHDTVFRGDTHPYPVYTVLSYGFTPGNEIMPCNKIDKPLVVYRLTGNVMTSITTLDTL